MGGKETENMEFYKYHSLGNDYLVYDCRKNEEELNPDKIVRICTRKFGIGIFSVGIMSCLKIIK